MLVAIVAAVIVAPLGALAPTAAAAEAGPAGVPGAGARDSARLEPSFRQEEQEQEERQGEEEREESGGKGAITGRVTSAATKDPIAGIKVCAIGEESHTGGCARTNSNGEYAVLDIDAGEYKVSFKVPHISEGLNDLPAAVEHVKVEEGETTEGIDLAMQAGGQVSGTVTGAAHGEAIAHVLVCAVEEGVQGFGSGEPSEEEEFRFYNCTESDAKGKYTVGSLEGGEYEIRFEAYSLLGSHPRQLNYLNQYYNDVPAGKRAIAKAARVKVSAGKTVENVNAQLLTGGQITGTVTSAVTAKPIEGMEVCGVNHKEIYETEYNCVLTNEKGEYDLIALETDTYEIFINEYERTVEGIEYGHAKIQGIKVTAGEAVSGKNVEVAANPHPPRPGDLAPTITGNAVVGETLQEHHGAWEGIVETYIYEWQRCNAEGSSCTAIPGATADSYTLTAADEGHRIRVSEAASNTHGTSVAVRSLFTAVVTAAKSSQSSSGSSGGKGAESSAAQHLAATVAAVSTTIAVRKRSATVRISCTGNATCEGTATLIVTIASHVHGHLRKRHVHVGAVPFSIAPDTTVSEVIKLNSTGTRRLTAAHGKLAAVILLAQTSPAPPHTTERAVKLVLQRPSRRGHR